MFPILKDAPDGWAILEAISTFGAAILAGLALIQASRIFNKQQRLTESIHQQQLLLTQRQLFMPLFDKLDEIKSVNHRDPNWKDVIDGVNFIDLLGVCWYGNLADKELLSKIFRDIVITLYDEIMLCKSPPPNVPNDGPTMLYSSRYATLLYKHFMGHVYENILEEYFSQVPPHSSITGDHDVTS